MWSFAVVDNYQGFKYEVFSIIQVQQGLLVT